MNEFNPNCFKLIVALMLFQFVLLTFIIALYCFLKDSSCDKCKKQTQEVEDTDVRLNDNDDDRRY